MSGPTLQDVAGTSRSIGLALSYMVPVIILPRIRRSPVAFAFFWWLVLGGATNLFSRWYAPRYQNTHAILLGYRLASVMLLGWVCYRAATEPQHRRMVTAGVALFVAFWLTVILTGLESPSSVSLYTSPAANFAQMLFGIFLVRQAMRDDSVPPLRQASAILGFGLVLAAASTIAAFPLVAATMRTSVQRAMMVKPLTSIPAHFALILWAIPYWKRSIVWTR
ncbi:MAG: hypothetical protein ABJC19_10835 [Gemmatimonadota bacterium]